MESQLFATELVRRLAAAAAVTYNRAGAGKDLNKAARGFLNVATCSGGGRPVLPAPTHGRRLSTDDAQGRRHRFPTGASRNTSTALQMRQFAQTYPEQFARWKSRMSSTVEHTTTAADTATVTAMNTAALVATATSGAAPRVAERTAMLSAKLRKLHQQQPEKFGKLLSREQRSNPNRFARHRKIWQQAARPNAPPEHQASSILATTATATAPHPPRSIDWSINRSFGRAQTTRA